MDIEYEATYEKVDREEIRNKLNNVGASLIRPEFMQTRVVFELPKGHEIDGGWIRVRDEGDKITMSLKAVNGNKIHNQREIMVEVDSFEEAERFLVSIGCEKKAFQESKRELWKIQNVEITIDEWPFLEPFVEIEGKSEEEVKAISGKLGFDYSKALFCAVDTLYNRKYGTDIEKINHDMPLITFKMKNPFIA
ncbi:MAG: CYTH domain-containing protein [Patescibacteria group bacterium]|nr:CYTH domain-containing protein [Patescibacteria group bacterium]